MTSCFCYDIISPGGGFPQSMFKPKNEHDRILHRLKITKGHLQKVLDMVSEDEYCINILHQSQAVQKALQQIDNLILENHLKTCATDAIKDGRGDKAIEEIMDLYKKSNS